MDSTKDTEPSPPRHTRDEDCTVGSDGCCTGCGVSHAGTCPHCGGHAYHRPDCIESAEPTPAPLVIPAGQACAAVLVAIANVAKAMGELEATACAVARALDHVTTEGTRP